MKLLVAISGGPGCHNQDDAVHHIRRAINFACLRAGFREADEATARSGQYAYKLHTTWLDDVGKSARENMDLYGYAGQHIRDLVQSSEFRYTHTLMAFNLPQCSP